MKENTNFMKTNVLKTEENTGFRPEDLQNALKKNMGLGCPKTLPGQLEKYCQQVENELERGPVTMRAANGGGKANIILARQVDSGPEDSAPNLPWRQTGRKSAYYTNQLSVILSSFFFNKMKEKDGFCGKADHFVEEVKATTEDAIKNMFIRVLDKVAQSAPAGVEIQDMKSLAGWLIPKPEGGYREDTDFNGKQHVFLELAQTRQEGSEWLVEGIGAIEMEYTLSIKNHKDKKKETHNSELDMTFRCVFYTEPEQLDHDWEEVKKITSEPEAGVRGVFPMEKESMVFGDYLPINLDTFVQGAPTPITKNELGVLILYAPEAKEVLKLDNRNGAGELSGSQSVTEGIAEGSGVALEEGITMEAGCEFAKVGVSMKSTVSVNSEKTKSVTKTITHTVGSGVCETLYQITTKYLIMKLNRETGELTVSTTDGKFFTDCYQAVQAAK